MHGATTSRTVAARPATTRNPRGPRAARPGQLTAWIGVWDEPGAFTDQGRRAVVRARHILLGALGVERSDIPPHPSKGVSP
jgi:hypothetical protein